MTKSRLKRNCKKIMIGLMVSSVLLTSSCATMSGNDASARKSLNAQDPYESYNRAMFTFNSGFYKYFVTPVSNVYGFILPEQFQHGVTSFFSNIAGPNAIGNDMLQAKFVRAGSDGMRLILNTVFGVFGLFDVASTMGFKKQAQNFGKTLYTWGWHDSAYFIIPFVGPSTIRDGLGMGVDYMANPWTYQAYFMKVPVLSNATNYELTALYVVNVYHNQLPRLKSITEYAIDPYIAVRSSYLQNLNYIYSDGKSRKISKS